MLCLCPSCLRCLCSAAPALWAAFPLLLCSYRTQQRRAAALRCLPAGLCLSCGEGGHRAQDTTKAGRLSAACSCPALLLCSCGLFCACRLPPVWRLPSLWLCRAFSALPALFSALPVDLHLWAALCAFCGLFLPSLCSSCHKGGKRAALCSCLPLLLKRSAGGSVQFLPLCSCPKEGRPFGLCCGLS